MCLIIITTNHVIRELCTAFYYTNTDWSHVVQLKLTPLSFLLVKQKKIIMAKKQTNPFPNQYQ